MCCNVESYTDRKNLHIHDREFSNGHYSHTVLTNCRNVVIENIEFKYKCNYTIILDRCSHIYIKNVNNKLKNARLIIKVRSGTNNVVIEDCNADKIVLGGFSEYEDYVLYEFADVGESVPLRLELFKPLPRTPVFNVKLIHSRINKVYKMNCIKKSINKYKCKILFNLSLSLFLTKLWFMLCNKFSEPRFIAKSHCHIKKEELDSSYHENMMNMYNEVVTLNKGNSI